MNNELLINVRRSARHLPTVREYAPADADLLVDRIAQRFVADRGRLWWWECLRTPSRPVLYPDEGAFDGIVRLVGSNSVTKLVITDDERPPWPVFEGPLLDILDLIGEQWFFEYFLVDDAERWCIFDTHHNSLVITGAL